MWDPWSDWAKGFTDGIGEERDGAPVARRKPAPGKVTLTQRIPPKAGTGTQIHRARASAEPLQASVAPLKQASTSIGFPLPEDMSAYLGAALGTDLSGVRLHADRDANAAADAYQARAFTHGRDIYFAHSEYDPDSATGQRLLYHEVAHTVQQGDDAAPAVQEKLHVAQPGDASELEADRVAEALVTGERVPRVGTRSTGMVLRTPIASATEHAHRTESRTDHTAAGQTGDEAAQGASSTDTWNHLIGEASTPVGKFARVKVPKGVRLRTEPHAGAETKAIMPLDTLARVERKTDHGWAYVIALGDARDADAVTGEGFCELDFLMLDPPEPAAHLHYVKGEMPKDIAARYYKGGGFDWGSDARLFVEAIWQANQGRTDGVYRQDVDLSWTDTLFRDEDAEETLRVWKSIGVRDSHAIWIPSRAFVAQLKAQGAISSGSIGHEAWQAAQGAMDELMDWATYRAGFVVGLVEGAYGSVRDLVMGVVDLAEMTYDIVKAIIEEGFVEACRSFGEKIVDFFENAPETLQTLGKWFADQWTAEDPWERGLFQGEVIGYVAMMIVLMILTMGAGAAAQAGGKFGQVVKLVRALDAAGDIMTYAGKLKRVVRIPDGVKKALKRSGDPENGLRRSMQGADSAGHGPPGSQRPEVRSGVSEDPGPLLRGGTLGERQQGLLRRLSRSDDLGPGLAEVGKREVTATDLAALTKHTGHEHALVVLKDNRRVLVDLGSYKGGALPANTRTLLMHSHPYDWGSGMAEFISKEDVDALLMLDQKYSYMVTVDGTVYRFTMSTAPNTVGEIVRQFHPVLGWVSP